VSPPYTNSQFIDCQRKRCISSKSILFQLAQGGIESAVYKKLIAPFKNDLPTSASDGFRRVCADHKYAFFGPDFLKNIYKLSLPCQLVPLPETSYKVPWAFIISKNSSYKGLINWRWDNKMNSYDRKFTTLRSSQVGQHIWTCLYIIRHTSINNRNVGMFCNISQNCYLLMYEIVNS